MAVLEIREKCSFKFGIPAAHDGSNHVPYKPRAELPFRIWHLAYVQTHASCGVPFTSASGRYPVILYSHSWNGSRSENTVQFEELASRGFIVVAMDHPYGSAKTSFPDGRVIQSDMFDFLGGATVDEVRATVQQTEAELAIRAGDARFVLNELERLDRNDPEGLFTSHIDMSRVGIIGYSFGGAVAAEASYLDKRIKAVVNIDGMLFGKSASCGIDRPYLFITERLPMRNESPQAAVSDTADTLRDKLLAQDVENERHTLTTHGGTLLEIPGATHSIFTVGPLHSPIARWRAAGRIDPHKAMIILNDYLTEFFFRNLRLPGSAHFFDLSTKYSEVRFQFWPSPDDFRPSTEHSPAPPVVQTKLQR